MPSTRQALTIAAVALLAVAVIFRTPLRDFVTGQRKVLGVL